ncbi:MAG: HNH endonuclease [Anaerolineae bacterium]
MFWMIIAVLGAIYKILFGDDHDGGGGLVDDLRRRRGSSPQVPSSGKPTSLAPPRIVPSRSRTQSLYWKQICEQVRERDHHRCCHCGTTRAELHVHHIKPVSRGGSDDLSNLITLCKYCHAGQHPGVADRIRDGQWKG